MPLHEISASLDSGRQIDYAEATSDTTVSATTEGTANTVVTGNAVIYDGATPVIIEFYASVVETGTTSGDQVIVGLFEDGTGIGILGQIRTPAASATAAPFRVARKRTPTAGSHTYSIRAWRFGTGNGTVYAGAGGTGTRFPAFIRITKAN